MRIVYCHACGAVSTNVWSERDVCTRCGRGAERMEFHRPWQYYLSTAILLGAAAFFVWGPLQDVLSRVLILIAVVALTFALSSWGLRQIRERILDQVRRRDAAEGKA